MNLDLKTMPTKLRLLMGNLARFRTIIFIVFFAAIYGFLIQRIGSLTSVEPTETQVQEELEITKRPRIDDEAIDKIEQLKAQNIEVQTLFNEARNNPFAE